MGRRIVTVFTALVLSAAFVISSNAADYKVTNAKWRLDNGRVMATWQANGQSPYLLWLYYGAAPSSTTKTLTAKRWSAIKCENDFSKEIAKYGVGCYRFVVQPTMSVTSEDEKSSDVLTVNETILKQIKDAIEFSGAAELKAHTISAAVSNTGHWQQDANGKHYILTNGTRASNGWQLIQGLWYLFDVNGNVMTGWHWVKGSDGFERCYFLDQNGVCAIGTVTPDGYTVDETGAWTVNGIVQKRTPAEDSVSASIKSRV